MDWFLLSKERQQTILEQTAARTGNLPIVIEKDIWVCIVLKVLFESEIKDYILFKGGTSLSKGYNIIRRFSEDIDICLDKSFLGFNEPLSNTQIDKLRIKVYDFAANLLTSLIQNGLIEIGVAIEIFSIEIEEQKAKKDPVKLIVSYQSVLKEEAGYVLPRIIIEVTGRSMNEPKEIIEINTEVFAQFANIPEANIRTTVSVAPPSRTCLDKIFLMYEELTKQEPRSERMSRHLFDIKKIIDHIGLDKILDITLFEEIKQHRKIYTPIKTVDYDSLNMQNINFLPEGQIKNLYNIDYDEMKENMFPDGEDNIDFEELSKILRVINDIINNHE